MIRFLGLGLLGLVVGVGLVGGCSSSDDASSAGDGNGVDSGPLADGAPGPIRPGASLDASNVADADTTAEHVVTTSETVTVRGQARSYLLSVPRTLDAAKSYPLVMALHGSPDSAQLQIGRQPFDRSSKETAIIVYPQALATDGPQGLWSWDLTNGSANNADIALIEALPAELVARGYKIDTTRIFGYGYSGGAFFLQVYQCLGNKIFRVLSTNAGGAPESLATGSGGPLSERFNDGAACLKCPGTPTPTIIIHGGDDAETTPESGLYEALCQAQNMGCTQTLTDVPPVPCQTYSGCPADKPLDFCFVPGVNHDPGWAEAVPTTWAFFTKYL